MSTFKLASKLGFDPPGNSLKFSNRPVQQLRTNKKIVTRSVTVTNKFLFRKDQNEAISNTIQPADDNIQHIYVKKTDKEITKTKGISKISESGLTYRDIKPIYNITISQNLVTAIENDPPISALLRKNIIKYLEINSERERKTAGEQIEKLIVKFAAKHPTARAYVPPTGYLSFTSILRLCLELAVLDFQKTLDYIADTVFRFLADLIRTFKLGEEKWNPNVKTKDEDGNPIKKDGKPIKYDPLISADVITGLKNIVREQIDSFSSLVTDNTNEELQPDPEYPRIEEFAPDTNLSILTVIREFMTGLLEIIEDVLEYIESIIKTANALLVGLINGLIELVAGIFQGIGDLIGLLGSNFTNTVDALAEAFKELSISDLKKFVVDQFKLLFAFAYEDDPYKSAYEFGIFIPKFILIIFELIFTGQAAIRTVRLINTYVKTNRVRKLLKIDSKVIKELRDNRFSLSHKVERTKPKRSSKDVVEEVTAELQEEVTEVTIYLKQDGKVLKTFNNPDDAIKYVNDLSKSTKRKKAFYGNNKGKKSREERLKKRRFTKPDFDEFVDSVDINFPFPDEKIAKRSYDLFLEEDWDGLYELFKKHKINGDWDPDGWPPSGGFISSKIKVLERGTKIDRYGGRVSKRTGKFSDRGRYFSDEGVDFNKRALNYEENDRTLSIYEVVQDMELEAGEIIPWFGKEGKGVQYLGQKGVNKLLEDGYIKLIEQIIR